MTSFIIVLISADIEWRAVHNLFPSAFIETSPYGEYFRLGPSQSESIVPTPNFQSPISNIQPPTSLLFFHGGWGKIAAAGSTQYVIDRWQPDLLINLGTCGGFAGRIERGTVILVEKTIVYDIIEQMGDPYAHIAQYTTEIDLSWLPDDHPTDIQRGLLVSADRDLLPEDIPMLIERFGAVAGDWESGAIAFVAARNHTRLLILRGVTDLVGVGGGEAYGGLEFFTVSANRMMKQLIEKLPGWLRVVFRCM